MLKSYCRILSGAKHRLSRSYHFASNEYLACFGDWDVLEVSGLRGQTIDYLDNFDSNSWYSNPQVTIISGVRYTDGKTADTIDAFTKVNGKQILSDPEQVDLVMEHMRTFTPQRDYREAVRNIEQDLLKNYGHVLAGNQALDFRKQDGITEIGEWSEAATVERRLSDLLLESEARGEIEIKRNPSFVGCVSNFSNFLDLCRKVLRHIELGVPVVVLSRSNTSQHMFRWTELLIELCDKHGVDKNLVTYLCANRSEKQRVMTTFADSPFFTTSSREVAKSIKKTSHHLMASTGGPNTMVAEMLTPEIIQAAAWSTMIENSGQCTAMRALICGESSSEDEIKEMFTKHALEVDTAKDSLKMGAFSGLFRDQPFSVEAGYTKLDDLPIAIRMNGNVFPEECEENWRSTYLDVTSGDLDDDATVQQAADWLNTHQPIALAVNGVDMPFDLFNDLFERTALVVYTVGCQAKPALTAQARPQDGEIFGEFPPRHVLSEYTKFPMVIPSPGPAYNSVYNEQFLLGQSNKTVQGDLGLKKLIGFVTDPVTRGFCITVADYITDATEVSPKLVPGPLGGRTSLFGLQRPPINTISVIRSDNYNDIASRLIPFTMTNARKSICVSTANIEVYERMRVLDIPCEVHTSEGFDEWCARHTPWNIIRPEALPEYALAGQFVSLLLPCGHVKSTRNNDQEFVDFMSKSAKWLRANN